MFLKTASIALFQSAGVAACVLRGLGGGVQHGAAEGGGARGAGAAVRGQGGAPLQDRAAPLPAVPQVTLSPHSLDYLPTHSCVTA